MRSALVLSGLLAAALAQVQVVVDVLYVELGDFSGSSYGYDASVVEANADSTVFAVEYEMTTYSDYSAYYYDDEYETVTTTYTFTQGESMYEAIVSDSTATASISCSIDGATYAVCDEAYTYSDEDVSSESKFKTTLSRRDMDYYPVTVTAGAEKILAIETAVAGASDAAVNAANSESVQTSAPRSTASTSATRTASSVANSDPAATQSPPAAAPSTGAASANLARGGAVAGIAAIAAVVMAL